VSAGKSATTITITITITITTTYELEDLELGELTKSFGDRAS